MSQLPQIENYQELFLNDIPMLDVRAPVEYLQGAFPNTENVPLINDEERHEIGICYKENGQEKAIELGHELVRDETREARINQWVKFTERYPHGALYCFRGGMRSRISQQWIYENTGVAYPRIAGGYKALRRYLIDELDNAAINIQAIILGGRTGTGKTLLLNRLKQMIDLEGIFQHRGSAFGKHPAPQPTQIDIENTLSISLLKQRNQHTQKIVFEDEAQSIGSRRIPDSLYQTMKQSPLVLLESDLQSRVKIVFDEYITNSLSEYQALFGEDEGFQKWSENLVNALGRIQQRLGGARHSEINAVMQDAIHQHQKGDDQHHIVWIERLLGEYYDPMYDYQLSKKMDRIIFRGEFEALLEYLEQQQVC